MAYADYDYYLNVYKGTEIQGQNNFIPVAEDASRRMDVATCFRLEQSPYATSDIVRKCCCAVAEALYAAKNSGVIDGDGRIIASETVGDHRISYDTSFAVMGAGLDSRIDGIIDQYLQCLGILRPAVMVRGGEVV